MAIKMETLQIRLPEKEYEDLDSLGKMLHSSRSEIARNVIHRGIKLLKMDMTVEQYLHHKFTLGRAAEYAGVSMQEMIDQLAKKGISFFRYPVSDLEQDIVTAGEWLDDV